MKVDFIDEFQSFDSGEEILNKLKDGNILEILLNRFRYLEVYFEFQCQ